MEEDKKKSGKTEHGMQLVHQPCSAGICTVLLLHNVFLYDIPVQWCLKRLGHHNEGITADYLRTCDCIPH